MTAGVLRLSNNWVIARLMTLYIEIFRNVPLLLWLLVIFAIFTEAAPPPSAYRGADPQADMWFWHSVAVTNRYVALPSPIFYRSLGDIDLVIFKVSLDLLAIIAALVIGIFVDRKIKARATRIQNATGKRPKTWWISLLLIVGLPVLVLIVLGFHFDYPVMKGFNFRGGILAPTPLFTLWLGLSIYTGTYIAEIVRAGILAVSRGQTEAASALGLRQNRVMNLVVLPQALRVIVPAADLAIPESDEELHPRGGGVLSGSDCDAGRDHPEPDRARAGMYPVDDDHLPHHQPADLSGDEPLQPVRPPEGALR